MDRQQADTIEVNGWALHRVGDDGELRILDVELGERLGYGKPRDIQRVIETLVKDDELLGVYRERRTAPSGNLRGFGPQTREVTSFYLTQREALKVIAKAQTKTAYKITGQVIDIYLAVRSAAAKGTLDEAAQRAILNEVERLRSERDATRAELDGVRAELANQQIAAVQTLRAEIEGMREAFETTFRARFEAIEHQLHITRVEVREASADCIGKYTAQSEILAPLRELAAIYSRRALDQTRAWRSKRKALDTRLRSRINLPQNRKWESLPKAQLADVRQGIREMAEDAKSWAVEQWGSPPLFAQQLQLPLYPEAATTVAKAN